VPQCVNNRITAASEPLSNAMWEASAAVGLQLAWTRLDIASIADWRSKLCSIFTRLVLHASKRHSVMLCL
jgi:hypothetical protein